MDGSGAGAEAFFAFATGAAPRLWKDARSTRGLRWNPAVQELTHFLRNLCTAGHVMGGMLLWMVRQSEEWGFVAASVLKEFGSHPASDRLVDFVICIRYFLRRVTDDERPVLPEDSRRLCQCLHELGALAGFLGWLAGNQICPLHLDPAFPALEWYIADDAAFANQFVRGLANVRLKERHAHLVANLQHHSSVYSMLLAFVDANDLRGSPAWVEAARNYFETGKHNRAAAQDLIHALGTCACPEGDCEWCFDAQLE
ncbi:hypothetical protein DFJ74DRAFT_135450 [Hyaloraphidium curvatum]|nr:hypothetical protein DFJ74DRAFT_135450 [Hyaloraphidium curvatum]